MAVSYIVESTCVLRACRDAGGFECERCSPYDRDSMETNRMCFCSVTMIEILLLQECAKL